MNKIIKIVKKNKKSILEKNKKEKDIKRKYIKEYI